MIISASRRTDLPAFYAPWFLNRLKAGYCLVKNPFNPKQVTRLELTPRAVEAFVFWTRNPKPFGPCLDVLDRQGQTYYFQFTVTPYGPPVEARRPPPKQSLASFRTLSERIGPERVIWRYDPIIVSNHSGWDYHAEMFRKLCGELAGCTKRVMFSFVHWYAKTGRRLAPLEKQGWRFKRQAATHPRAMELVSFMARTAAEQGMGLFTCASGVDFTPAGARAGACVDGELIARLRGGGIWPPDKGQREHCGCVQSKDLGAPHTCLHGCAYCYATVSDSVAAKNRALHDPKGEGMLP